MCRLSYYDPRYSWGATRNRLPVRVSNFTTIRENSFGISELSNAAGSNRNFRSKVVCIPTDPALKTCCIGRNGSNGFAAEPQTFTHDNFFGVRLCGPLPVNWLSS